MNDGQDRLVWGNQEQAVAAWVNYLNQVRLNELVANLQVQDHNLATAMTSITGAFGAIDNEIVARNRGGLKGMHGFIAEVAEVGIANARKQIVGEQGAAQWVNDNGPADLIRNGVEIQQKFVASGGRFGLGAIAEHHEKYPDFLANGGKYQVAADHFEAIKTLHGMSAEEAQKLLGNGQGGFSIRQWNKVQEFFQAEDLPFDSLEPSTLEYSQAQRGAYARTLADEGDSLLVTDQEQRSAAHDASKPSPGQAAQATVGAALVEGGTAFVMAVIAKQRSGVKLGEFTGDDWAAIGAESGLGAVRGGVRGLSIYALTNFTATPAAVASSLVTASISIADQAGKFRRGEITELQFIENSEVIALETAVSALSSFVGQAVIPIPVIGAVIGNTVGMVIYRAMGSALSERETKILMVHALEYQAQKILLHSEHQALLAELDEALDQYLTLVDQAFSPDLGEALEGSIALARLLGVEGVLDSEAKIADFFLA